MTERTLVLALMLAACGGSVPYGSFITGREPAQAAIAADVAKKLASSLPGTAQAIRFAHPAHDAFGRGLAAELRKEGFAVRSKPADSELVLHYVVDTVKGSDLLRATIYVRDQTFARAYVQRASGLYPVGPWSVGVLHGS